MNILSNSMLNATVLKYHDVDINKYDYGKGITANFIEHAAEKYNLEYNKPANTKITALLYKNNEIARMTGLRPSSTADIAYRLCKDKFKLEKYLQLMKLNTLSSEHFMENEHDDALNYVRNNKKQTFVIKPLNLAGGKGIQFNVNEENFSKHWEASIETQKTEGVLKPSCVIQPFVNGFDIRVTIIEGRYCGALLRLPAHVVGDGMKTILELISSKNELRKSISYFRNKLIIDDKRLDSYLDNKGISKEFIPEKNQVVMLSEISNLTHGGESIDITNELSNDIKELAINAAAAIPGLYSTGIDIMTEDYKKGEGFIIEMNTSANLTMHHLPLKGKKRFPYHFFVRTNLIKYKVENNILLTKKEQEIWFEVSKFFKLKDRYACATLKLIDF